MYDQIHSFRNAHANKSKDVHEGAEAPLIGAAAAASSFFTNLAINTSDFSHRLKRRDTLINRPTTLASSAEKEQVNGQVQDEAITSAHLAKLANRMACKTYEGDWQANFETEPELRGAAKMHALLAAREAEQGHASQVASATLHYAGDMTKTGLKGKFRAWSKKGIF